MRNKYCKDDRVVATLLDWSLVRGRVYEATESYVRIVEDGTEDMVEVPVEAVRFENE